MGNKAGAAAPNAEQIEAWNGAMGAKWVLYQSRLDRMIEPFGNAVLKAAAIKPGERVIDVGCGCGATTLEAATRAGAAGRVLGVDISVPMIERAKARNAELGRNANFALADASLQDFGLDAFDVLISRFGVMFFDDPVSAFANLRRSLAQNGRLAFVCWRAPMENPWLAAPLLAALPHLPPPEPTPPDAPGPFAFADSDRVATILKEAGFHEVRLTPFNAMVVLGLPGGDPLAEALDQALTIGPLSRLLTDQPAEVREKVKAAVSAELSKHRTSDGIALPGGSWIVTAQA